MISRVATFGVGLTFAAMFGVLTLSAATLHVQVVEHGTGAPVRAVVVATGHFPRIISGLTDVSGSVTLELPELERVSVAVRSDSHGTRCVPPEEVARGSVIVKMAPSVRVYGVVTDIEGTPIPDVSVIPEYQLQPGCRVRFDVGAPPIRTNKRGEFVVRNVDLERSPVIEFRHPAMKTTRVDKASFTDQYHVALRKELNVRLDPQ